MRKTIVEKNGIEKTFFVDDELLEAIKTGNVRIHVISYAFSPYYNCATGGWMCDYTHPAYEYDFTSIEESLRYCKTCDRVCHVSLNGKPVTISYLECVAKV